ncbi:MAG: DegV family protein [Clostridiales bacterium]|nr:DegV family protein [Clostridiales bacterium]
MTKPVLITSDTASDLGAELCARYNIPLIPLHVLVDGTDYLDGVNIDVDRIYQIWGEKKVLPKTSAINAEEFSAFFAPFVEQGYAVVHVSIGSGLSASCQAAHAAAALFPDVYVVDSCSLSTGIGLLALEGCDQAKAGSGAQAIAESLTALAQKNRASFIIDSLDFLRAGGRCSALAQLGASMMNLKPTILVKNDDGGLMGVGKKYVGKLARSMPKYLADQLQGRGDIVLNRAFLTHSGLPQEMLDLAVETVKGIASFDELFVTRAGATISSHCGPGTIGVLFMTK